MDLKQKKERKLRIILIVVGIAIGLGLIELLMVTNSNFGISFPEVVDSPLQSVPTNQVAKYLYYPSPWYYAIPLKSTRMRAMTEPFSQFYSYKAKNNSHGFRTREYTIAHPPNTFRIVVIGDSTTWGQGVLQENLYAYQFEKLLTENRKEKDINLEVIALGVAGSRLIDNIIRLFAHAQELKPDLLIFQHLANDVEYGLEMANFFRKPSDAIQKAFYKHTALGKALKDINQGLAYTEKIKLTFAPGSFDRMFFEATLKELKTWQNKTQTKIAFVAFPDFKCNRNDSALYSESDSFMEAVLLRAKVLQDISKLGFTLLDLLDAFKKGAGEQFLCVSDSDGHPNAIAHKLAAEALKEFIIENQFIPTDKNLLPEADIKWEQENILRQEAVLNWGEYNSSYSVQQKFYEKLKRLYPQNAWITAQLAYVNHKQGNHSESYQLYESLIQLAPKISAPWDLMAQNVSNKDGEKEKLLEKMLEVIPGNVSVMVQIADIKKNKGDLEKACILYDSVANNPQYKKQLEVALQFLEDNKCPSNY